MTRRKNMDTQYRLSLCQVSHQSNFLPFFFLSNKNAAKRMLSKTPKLHMDPNQIRQVTPTCPVFSAMCSQRSIALTLPQWKSISSLPWPVFSVRTILSFLSLVPAYLPTLPTQMDCHPLRGRKNEQAVENRQSGCRNACRG